MESPEKISLEKWEDYHYWQFIFRRQHGLSINYFLDWLKQLNFILINENDFSKLLSGNYKNLIKINKIAEGRISKLASAVRNFQKYYQNTPNLKFPIQTVASKTEWVLESLSEVSTLMSRQIGISLENMHIQDLSVQVFCQVDLNIFLNIEFCPANCLHSQDSNIQILEVAIQTALRDQEIDIGNYQIVVEKIRIIPKKFK